MHHWQGAGLTLAGDSWGNRAGPLVILQHGGGQTRHAWKGVGAKLGNAGYHAVAFDARGHGDSDWAPDGLYSQDAMVEDLKCVVAALDGARPVLVGASMGGGTSLVAVGEQHVDAAALVLVDIAPRIEREGVHKIQAFMSLKPEGFDSLDEVADAIAGYQPYRERPASLQGLAKNVRLGDDGRYHWHWDPRFHTAPRDLGRREQRLSASARRLDVPTLLIRGGMSDVVSEDGVHAFLKLCPHAEYVNVASAGHMVAGDRNDVFGRAVIDFLGRVVPASMSRAPTPRKAAPPPAGATGTDADIP
jgi:pimeloyl-ACP methyl ester carboxylesterase